MLSSEDGLVVLEVQGPSAEASESSLVYEMQDVLLSLIMSDFGSVVLSVHMSST